MTFDAVMYIYYCVLLFLAGMAGLSAIAIAWAEETGAKRTVIICIGAFITLSSGLILLALSK